MMSDIWDRLEKREKKRGYIGGLLHDAAARGRELEAEVETLRATHGHEAAKRCGRYREALVQITWDGCETSKRIAREALEKDE